MNFDNFLYNSRPFLNYLFDFYSNLEDKKLEDIVKEAGNTENISILVVDMLNGFCKEGPLASPRVKKLINPIKELILKSKSSNINNVYFLNDAHIVNTKEFNEFLPHCIKDNYESQIVDELKEIVGEDPIIFEKNSLNGFFEKDFDNSNKLLEMVLSKLKRDNATFIIVGDCTDLCVYQTAMSIKLIANARNIDANVIIPENCVDTYDISVTVAEGEKIIPHDGNLLHIMFLYHMKLNGIKIYKEIF